MSDHLDLNENKYTDKCPHCGKEFLVTEYEQIPGFRDIEEETCPYCNKTVRTSMEYEFTTERIEQK